MRLLRDGVTRGGTWADLGAGAGAFTLALAELVGPSGEVIAVDRDRGALRELERAIRPGGAAVRALGADFTKPIDLPSLDGIVMANSLHFVKDKAPVLALVHHMLKRSGRLLLVEYDADKGNHWVPYPMSFETWRALATPTDSRARASSGACRVASRTDLFRSERRGPEVTRRPRLVPGPFMVQRDRSVLESSCDLLCDCSQRRQERRAVLRSRRRLEGEVRLCLQDEQGGHRGTPCTDRSGICGVSDRL